MKVFSVLVFLSQLRAAVAGYGYVGGQLNYNEGQMEELCRQNHFNAVCTKEELEGNSMCACGWTFGDSTQGYYWMSSATSGCGNREGYHTCAATAMGVHCCDAYAGPPPPSPSPPPPRMHTYVGPATFVYTDAEYQCHQHGINDICDQYELQGQMANCTGRSLLRRLVTASTSPITSPPTSFTTTTFTIPTAPLASPSPPITYYPAVGFGRCVNEYGATANSFQLTNGRTKEDCQNECNKISTCIGYTWQLGGEPVCQVFFTESCENFETRLNCRTGDGALIITTGNPSALPTATCFAPFSPASQVYAAGACGYGELGVGSTAASQTLAQVETLPSTVSSVLPGNSHTLFVTAEGGALASGSNTFGQISCEACATGGSNELYPVVADLVGSYDIASVTAGNERSFFVTKSDGCSVDFNMEVASGTFERSYSSDILVSNEEECLQACRADSTCTVWEYSYVGGSPNCYLGIQENPQLVPSSTKNSGYRCQGGEVYAVGNNVHGSLGDGTSVNRLTPVQVLSSHVVMQVCGGDSHTLFLTSGYTVWASGDNTYGQLGQDLSVRSSTTPLKLPLSSKYKVVDIECGPEQSFFKTAGEFQSMHSATEANTTASLAYGYGSEAGFVNGLRSGDVIEWSVANDGSQAAPQHFTLQLLYSLGLAEGACGECPMLLSSSAEDAQEITFCGTSSNSEWGIKELAMPLGYGSNTVRLESTRPDCAVNFGSLTVRGQEWFATGNNAYGQLGDGSTSTPSPSDP
ncbi:hypothetical protein CYMTET_14368, partial [Cymbomonas tetramitiformis]